MPENVVAQSGKTVQVATLADVSGEASEIPNADLGTRGLVLMATPVPDVQTVIVTDIASAATAIAAIGTTLSELQQALRAAGIIANP